MKSRNPNVRGVLAELFRNCFAKNAVIGRRPTDSRRRSLRRKARTTGRVSFTAAPAVESLENRTLLATITWNTDANGFWDDAANWDLGREPVSSDEVIIDRGAANPVVTVRTATGRFFQVASEETIVIEASGGLGTSDSTFNGLVQINGGSLFVEGGGTVTLNDVEWSGGNIGGAGTGGGSYTLNGTMTVSGSDGKSIGGGLTNNGTVNITGNGNLIVSTTINNEAGAVWDFQSDADFVTSTMTFNNRGMLRKSGGTGETTLASTTSTQVNHFGGTVEVTSGRLSLARAGANVNNVPSTGATFVAGAGAVLDLSGGAHSLFYAGTFTGSGDGRVELSAGTLDTRSDGGVTFNFPDGLLHWTGGSIVTDAPGGDFFTNIGFVTLSGDGHKALSSNGTFVNDGTVFVDGGGTFGGGIVDNNAGAVWDFRSDADFAVATTTFNNRGTLRKSGGTDVSTMNVAVNSQVNHLGGTVDVSSGTLALAGSDRNHVAEHGATFTVATGAVLDLTGGNTSAYFTGLTTGTGAGRVELSSGTLRTDRLNGGDATFDFSDGLFHWTGGAIVSTAADPFINVGSMTLSGGDQKTLSNGYLVNEGTLRHRDSGVFSGGIAATIDNRAGGVWDFETDTTTDRLRLVNAGTVRKSGGTSESLLGGTNSGLAMVGGTIEAQSGRLQIAGVQNVFGFESTGGHFIASAGAVVEFAPANITLGGTYTGSGAGRVELTTFIGGNTVNPARLDFPEGMFHWIGNDSTNSFGSIINDGFVTIDGPEAVRARADIRNYGTVIQSDGSHFTLLQTVNIVNQGTWDLRGDADLEIVDFSNLGSTFYNFGTLQKSAGLGTSRLFARYSATSFLSNLGTVDVQSGTLDIDLRTKQFDVAIGDDMLHGGTWRAGPFATLRLLDSTGSVPDITSSAAHIILDGTASAFPNINALAVNSGVFELQNGRDFSTAGNFTNGAERFDLPVDEVFIRNDLRLIALAVDEASGNLYSIRAGQDIRRFTPEGVEILPALPRPDAQPDSFSDLDATPVALNVGGTSIPAGSLIYISGQVAPPIVYALDSTTGAELATVTLATVSAATPGVAVHPTRGTLYVLNQTGDIHEVNPATGATLATFSINPSGNPGFSLNWGDVDVIGSTGNLLVAGSNVEFLRELTATGEFVRDIDLSHSGISSTAARLSPAALAYNDATGELWVQNESSTIARLSSIDFGTFGTTTLGPGSTLTVNGDFTDASPNTVNIQIGGRPASGDFGNLDITGAADFTSGRINVELANGFGPTEGDQYEVITYASRTGDIGQFSGLAPFFSAAVNPTNVLLNGEMTALSGDLAVDVTGFTLPATAMPGEEFTLSYIVNNLSSNALSGTWTDSVYLSDDTTFDADDVLVARGDHVGGIAGNGSYTESVTATFPGVDVGDWFVFVVADSRGSVSDTDRTNNRGVSSSAIESTVPLLPFDTLVSNTVANGQDVYYRVDVPDGRGDLRFDLSFEQDEQAEVFVSRAVLPTRSIFDFTASNLLELNRTITVPAAQAESYYVLIHGREGTGGGTGFDIKVHRVEFSVDSITPAHGANSGQASTLISGAGFTDSAVVTLRSATGSVVATATVVQNDPNHLFATFDLVGIDPGTYDMHVADGSSSGSQSAAYEVVVGNPGDLQVRLVTPGSLRGGRLYTGYFEYTNIGDTDLVSPIITITSTQPLTLDLHGDPSTNVLRQLAISPAGTTGPAGILAPGQTVRVPFRFRGADMTIEATSMSSDIAEPMDWDALRAEIRPASADAAWDAAFDGEFVSAGSTIGDYVRRLSEGATLYRLRNGIGEADLNSLMTFILTEGITDQQTSLQAQVALDEPNRPASGVLARAVNDVTGETFAARAADDGLLRWINLPDGNYSVHFEEVLPPENLTSVEVTSIAVADLGLLVTRTGGGIIGRVAIDDSVPMPGADEALTVTAAHADGTRYTAFVDERGVYEFAGLPDGRYLLEFSTDTAIPTTAVVDVVAGAVAGLIDLATTSGGTVSGTTLDATTSQPVADVTVIVDSLDGNVRTVRSDENGFYSIEGVTSGTVTVIARITGAAETRIDNVAVMQNVTTANVNLPIDFSTLGTVTGTVTAGGQPVANAGVDLEISATIIIAGTTDENGQFTIPGVEPGTYDIVVTALGFAEATTSIAVAANSTTTQDVSLDPVASVQGTVTQTGINAFNPLPDLPLVLVNPAGDFVLHYTDADGRFEVDRLSPGNYSLMLPDGSHRHDFTVTGNTDEIAIDFEISAGAVLGQVFDTNGTSALEGVRVSLLADGQVVATSITDSVGLYVFPLVSPGTYALRFFSEAASIARQNDVVVSAGGFAVVNVQASTASMTLTIVDETSALITSDLTIALSPAGDTSAVPRVASTSAGTVTFDNLSPGDYRVRITDAMGTSQRIVTIVDGLNSIEQTIGPKTTLSGVLTDSSGSPVSAATVAIYDAALPELQWLVTTDASGAWQIMLPDGTYRITPTEQGSDIELTGVPATPATVTLGGTPIVQNLQLAAPTSEITGTLAAAGSEPEASAPVAAIVTLSSEDGIEIASVLTNADGSFAFAGLQDGTYSMTATAPGYSFASSTITVVGSMAVTISGTWHVPAYGLTPTVAPAPSGFASAALPSFGELASTITAGVNRLREIVREGLGEPEADGTRIRAIPIPAECDPAIAEAARRALRKALEWQRAADGFFDNWVERWEGQQQTLWANIGLFGVNLLQFASELIVNARVVSRLDEIASTQYRLLDFLVDNPQLENEVYAVYNQLQRQYDNIQASLTLAVSTTQQGLRNVGAIGTAIGTGTTYFVEGAATSIGDVWNSIVRLGTARDLNAASNVVSKLTGFAGTLGTYASALTTLIPRLATLAERVPALDRLVSNLGPITAALNTISAAAQGVTDQLGDIEQLNQFEETYRNAINNRDGWFEGFLDLISQCREDDDDTHEPDMPNRREFFRALATVRSRDPNDIAGPDGFGDQHFVQSDLVFPYLILFENKPEATAPAQEVFITQQLSGDLDWTTFELGNFGWGDLTFDVPPGLRTYDTRIDLTETLGFYVDVHADIDLSTGIASWAFTSTDPETGDLISDALAGFLPPNATSPEGEGFVEYSIRPMSDIADESQIDAQARIIFDLNEPIDTPVYSNTIDDTPPSSSVETLPVLTKTQSFAVSWSGDDGTGSGIASFDIYVADDGGPFVLWFDDTTGTSAIYNGQDGHTYQFYSVARDNVGLTEADSGGDAQTTLSVSVPFVTGPNVRTSDATPAVTWSDVPGAALYEVWIGDLTNGRAPVIAQTALTSFVPADPLPIGRYRAWVRVKDGSNGEGGWSTGRTFSVTTPTTLNSLPFHANADRTPEISWQPVDGAAMYELWVNNVITGQARVIHETSLTDASFTPTDDLGFGIHQIWVRAVDAAGGRSDWSVPVNIYIGPQLVNPQSPTFDVQPMFEWTSLAGIASYEIFVRTVDGDIRESGLTGTSWTPPTPLPDGPMRWWIRPTADNNRVAPWSDVATSDIGGRTTVLAPTGTVSDTLPTFAWQAVDGAARYILYVERIGDGLVFRNDNVTTTTFTATTPLSAGTYRVWVKAISSSDNVSGYWSRPLEFTVATAGATALPPATPAGILEDLDQIFLGDPFATL
ncbi:MAG: carboxypeptidase regulatory-like domain-containing protein [Planctomycetaceae bacterium]